MRRPLASRIYGALLRILPLPFSTAHGQDMLELFEEALGAHRERGRLVWLAAWMRGAVDVTFLAVRLRLRSSPRRWGRSAGAGILGSFLEDLQFAVRTLGHRRLNAMVAILTLGLAVGAATAMFGVVDGVLLKELPYDEPHRLVEIWQTVPFERGRPGNDGVRWGRTRLTYAQYRALWENTAAYTGLAAYRAGNPDVATLTGVGDPVELRAGAASASLLTLLAVAPYRGRWFLPEEEASMAGNDGASVAVISQELWETRFGGSPETVGSTVTLDDRRFTIVGVLPAGFRLTWISASVAGESNPGRRDIWFPIGAPGWAGTRQGYSWEVIGRLAPEVTLDRALAETQAVISSHPDSFGEARVLPRDVEERRGLAPPLLLLLGATGLLLLIACGNIASLATAELQGRRSELATRSAVGAGRGRIVRLLLTESLLLAVLGSLLGIALALTGTEVLLALAPPIPRLHEVGIDLRVLGFATFLAVCTAFLFGAGPSVVASRRPASFLLMGSTRTSQGRRRISGAVMGAEIALTVMLLVAGGLLTRSLSRLLSIDPGFDARGLVTAEVRLPPSRYPRANNGEFFQEALSRLRAIPGIGTVSGASRLPFPGETSAMSLRVDGQNHTILFYQVASGYLETLGVPLLAGRALDETDGPGAPPAIVVNETAARRIWQRDSPVGAQVSLSHPNEPVTVVGVVGDMKRQELSAEADPAFYIPFTQLPDETICFVARTRMDPREALTLMREAIRSLDPELVARNSTTLARLVGQSASEQRYRTLLMNAFGLLAALLAAAGVTGVTARSVSLRTREMGIKMALGARGSGLVKATVGGHLRIALVGTGLGLAGAFWASKLLSGFLFGIETFDPPTYAVVTLLTLVLAMAASYLPARRISRVDPVEVLKVE